MKRTIVLAASILVGVAAAVLTRVYVSVKEAEIKEQKDALNRRYGTIEILVFARDIPTGTVLAATDLEPRVAPKLGLRGQAITRESLVDVVGRKVLLSHEAGEVVFWSDIDGGNPADRGLSADLKPKMRAISINCSGAAAVSGMVKPNDHVDVIGTFSFPKPSPDGKNILQELITCTILQNVLVLATGKETAKSPTPLFGGGAYSTVTLEVTPREAEMLVFAEQIKGRLVLSLRHVLRKGTSAGRLRKDSRRDRGA